MSDAAEVGRLIVCVLHGLVGMSLSSTAESKTDETIVNRTVR
jgi:hypothetical protein